MQNEFNPVEITKTLISIPSYPREGGAEEDIASYIEKFAKENFSFKYSVRRQFIDDKRYNLILTTSSDPENSSLIFCCHMDTVLPAVGQISDDGTPMVEEDGGKIKGLGSVDMKGGIAALLCSVSEFSNPKGLTVIFYCDEEGGFAGMKKLLKDYKFKAPLCIFTEPTDLRIANGCRGLIEYTAYIYGSTAHAAVASEGLNAIKVASDAFMVFERDISVYKHPNLG